MEHDLKYYLARKEDNMQLNFRSHEFGFTLKNKVHLKNLKEANFEDISPYIELLVNSQNEIAFVEWPFFENPLKEIEVELPYFKKVSIPGRYDVPELGVKMLLLWKSWRLLKCITKIKLKRKDQSTASS